MEGEDNPLAQTPRTRLADITVLGACIHVRKRYFPAAPWVAGEQFWPSVNRIDNVYGDRQPVLRLARDSKPYEELMVPVQAHAAAYVFYR